MSSFRLGFDFLQKSPKRITPLFLFLHRTFYTTDFKKWKPVFDEDAARRKAAGSKGCRLFHSEKDPNEVVVLCQWKDLGRAHRFAESEDTHRAMERASVVGKPEVLLRRDREIHCVI